MARTSGLSEQFVDPVTRIPVARRDWVRLMNELGIRPNKGLGQHFLFERGIVERMVRLAGVNSTDTVLEVGPGLGILTSELLRKADRVIAIERDPALVTHLNSVFGDLPSLTLFQGNALTMDNREIVPAGMPFDVVANLPYSVGTAILRHLMEQPRKPRRITAMLQKEVAERLVAQPPDMSVLSVAAQFYAVPRLLFTVSPTVFIPPPTVESAVVSLEMLQTPRLPEEQMERFFSIVNAGFRQKRKQLANSLSDVLKIPKPTVGEWLIRNDIDPMRRAETLTLDEWVALAQDESVSASGSW